VVSKSLESFENIAIFYFIYLKINYFLKSKSFFGWKFETLNEFP